MDKKLKPVFCEIALFSFNIGEEHLPPVSRELHGPGICQYCGEQRDVLKIEPRSQKNYCRKCAPGRETDEDWPNYQTHKQQTTRQGRDSVDGPVRRSGCMRCLGTGWKTVCRKTGAQERCNCSPNYSPFDDPPEYHESFA